MFFNVIIDSIVHTYLHRTCQAREGAGGGRVEVKTLISSTAAAVVVVGAAIYRTYSSKQFYMASYVQQSDCNITILWQRQQWRS